MHQIDLVRRRGAVRALLTLVTLVLLAAALAAPANAERYIHRDRAHDVRGVVFDGGEGLVRAPHRKQGDYVKVKIWHQVKAVRVVGKFRRLDRVGDGLSQIVSIKTAHGVFDFQVVAGPGMWRGVRGAGDEGSERAGCIIGHKVNYKRDRFSMRISRSCLGRPAWVRVGVGFISFNGRGFFADDGQLRHVRNELGWSPRLEHA